MEVHQIVGFALLFTGALDAGIGLFVVGPKLPADRRPVVVGAMILGAVVMAALGVAFLLKWIPIGGA
ncbi:MAG: hypothetical protein ACF8XB_09220 [Planctomycetota bacterium JB042]